MADTATSLLSTFLHPVRAFAPQTLVRWNDATQVLPTLNLPCHGDASIAVDLYAGRFRFAGETIEATPATVFNVAAPSALWRAELLSFYWLQHFRSSGKIMHARMASRLLDAWGQSKQFPAEAGAAAQALLNVCSHGPYIIDQTVPMAGSNFQALLRQQLRRLGKLKPYSAAEALHKSAATLACLLITDAPQANLRSAIAEMANFADKVFEGDGSHITGNARAGLATVELLNALCKACGQKEVLEPVALTGILGSALSYLTLLEMPTGTLAFAPDDITAGPVLKSIKAARPDLVADKKTLPHLAPHGCHARLAGGETVVMVQFKAALTQGLRVEIEVWRKGEVSFVCTDDLAEADQWRAGLPQVFSADGGTLFSMPCLTEQGGRRALSIFLSRDGTDLRIESEYAFAEQPPVLRLMPADVGKLSPQQNGIGAVITGGRNQSWQMTSRGAKLLRDQHDICLVQTPSQPRMNLAFRVATAAKRQTRTPDVGTLL